MKVPKPKGALPAINVQHPFARRLLDGSKSIETRTYACPELYMNTPVVVLETSGSSQTFRKRAIGIVRITECFAYKNKKEFYADQKRHLVQRNSEFAWKTKAKWGWKIEVVSVFANPVEIKQRTGIVYTRALRGFSLGNRSPV